MGTYWGRQAYLKAKTLVGKPYVYGGNYPPLGDSEGTDCSGLLQWGYHEVGIELLRTTQQQCHQYPVVGPYYNGDALFFCRRRWSAPRSRWALCGLWRTRRIPAQLGRKR